MPADGGKTEALTAFKGGVSEFAWAPDSRQLALIGADAPDEPAKLPDGEDGPAKPIVTTRLQFKDDASGYLDDKRSPLRLLEIATKKDTLLSPGQHDEWSPAFSPDGTQILTSGQPGDNTARLWDVQTATQVLTITLEGIVIRAIFSPDGKNILTGSNDGIARLWDARTGEMLREFKGHTDRNTGLDFSPDGKLIVTGSPDKTARLWDVQTTKEVRKFTGHTGGVRGVTFSPDGKYILTGSDDTRRTTSSLNRWTATKLGH
jgi:Tol biopolymer transport system component